MVYVEDANNAGEAPRFNSFDRNMEHVGAERFCLDRSEVLQVVGAVPVLLNSSSLDAREEKKERRTRGVAARRGNEGKWPLGFGSGLIRMGDRAWSRLIAGRGRGIARCASVQRRKKHSRIKEVSWARIWWASVERAKEEK